MISSFKKGNGLYKPKHFPCLEGSARRKKTEMLGEQRGLESIKKSPVLAPEFYFRYQQNQNNSTLLIPMGFLPEMELREPAAHRIIIIIHVIEPKYITLWDTPHHDMGLIEIFRQLK